MLPFKTFYMTIIKRSLVCCIFWATCIF